MDAILHNFLSAELAAGLRLAEASDCLRLLPLGPEPVQRYLAHFDAATLVRDASGRVRAAQGFTVGLSFPSDYLRRADPFAVAAFLAPAEVFLPNVRPPFLCLGRIAPGTGLCDLLYQAFEIGTGAKVTMREDDALNAEACAWARRNLDRFPVDRRSLKRTDFVVEQLP
ncbi:MAG: hypothetical protein U0802_23380 [Candidatus Binatia bacterium]